MKDKTEKLYTEEEVNQIVKNKISEKFNNLYKKCNCNSWDELFYCANLGKTILLSKSRKDNDLPSDPMYLQRLSKEARELIENHKPNIYHSVMALISNGITMDAKDFCEYYIGKYPTRTYLAENKELVFEIINCCYKTKNFITNGKGNKYARIC